MFKARCYLVIGLFNLMSFLSLAQDQNLADSLAIVYKQGKLKDTAKMELLRNLSFNEVSDIQLSIRYADELISLAQKEDNPLYLFRGYLNKGNKKKIMGDLEEALECYFKGLKAVEFTPYNLGKGAAYSAIAGVYKISNNYESSKYYFQKAIVLLEEAQDTIALASAILNAGSALSDLEDYDSALIYFNQAKILYGKVGYLTGQAFSLGNLGTVLARIGDQQLAEQYINQAIDLLMSSRNYYPICLYLRSMADVYLEKNDIPNALKYANRSIELAEEFNLKQQVSDANLTLSEVYEKGRDFEQSLNFYKKHIIYRDSILNLNTVQKLSNQRTAFEVSLKEKEMEEQKLLSYTYIIIAVVLLICAVVVILYFRQRFVNIRLLAAQERKQHNEEIKNLLNSQETKTLQSMVKGQENERKRLAQELHNHFGSLLATIKVNINSIDEEAIPNHGILSKLIDQACVDIRNASHELNMGISNQFGLVPALRELTLHLQQANDLKVEFSAALGDEILNSEDEIVVYRIVQELVSNVLKHAQASRLSISLTYFSEENLMNILVQDNGKGFEVLPMENKTPGIGLSSLINLVQDLHGETSIDSNPGRGTTVSIDLPITPQELEVM